MAGKFERIVDPGPASRCRGRGGSQLIHPRWLKAVKCFFLPLWYCLALSVLVLLQISPADFESYTAAMRKQLFGSVPKKKYIKLQEVGSDVLDLLMHNA